MTTGEKFDEMTGGDLDIDDPRGRCALAVQLEGPEEAELGAIKIQRALQIADIECDMSNSCDHSIFLFRCVAEHCPIQFLLVQHTATPNVKYTLMSP